MPVVLVVDDSAMDRQRIGGLLGKLEGHSVVYAEDAESALVRIQQAVPDVVVTDLNMPGLSGLDLISQVKEQYPRLPVVMMTSRGSEELAVQALQQGAASYVSKHSAAERLIDTVSHVLSLAEENRSQAQLLEFLVEKSVHFQLENDPELLGTAVKHLLSVAESFGICSESERVRVGVALQEALTNACFHGNLEVSSSLREEDHHAYYNLAKERALKSPYRERRIQLMAQFNRQRATFIIRDEGPGFNPGSLPDPTDPENLDRPCGRGLLLMRTFMDAVDYNDLGNEVTLTKSCGSRNGHLERSQR